MISIYIIYSSMYILFVDDTTDNLIGTNWLKLRTLSVQNNYLSPDFNFLKKMPSLKKQNLKIYLVYTYNLLTSKGHSGGFFT